MSTRQPPVAAQSSQSQPPAERRTFITVLLAAEVSDILYHHLYCFSTLSSPYYLPLSPFTSSSSPSIKPCWPRGPSSVRASLCSPVIKSITPPSLTPIIQTAAIIFVNMSAITVIIVIIAIIIIVIVLITTMSHLKVAYLEGLLATRLAESAAKEERKKKPRHAPRPTEVHRDLLLL